MGTEHDQAMKVFESRGFSEGGEARVSDIKHTAAVLLNVINGIEGGSDVNRLTAIAKTHLETCVMFAVKAVSRR